MVLHLVIGLCGLVLFFAATAAGGAFLNIHYMRKENKRLKDKDVIEAKKQKLMLAIVQHKEYCQTYNVLRESFSSSLSVLSQELMQHISVLTVPLLDELDDNWKNELKTSARPSSKIEFNGEVSDYVSKLEPLQKCHLIEYMNFVKLVTCSLPIVSEVELIKQHNFIMNVINASPSDKVARTKVVSSINCLKTNFVSRDRLGVLIDAVETLRLTGTQVAVEMNKLRYSETKSQTMIEEALSGVPDVLIINFLISRYSYLEYMGFETLLLSDSIKETERLALNTLSERGTRLERKLANLDKLFEPHNDEVQLFPLFGRYTSELPDFVKQNFNQNVIFRAFED
ncbi:hypothetical protein D5E85_24930 [Vibrio parahaemolyticus]|nr:hypothetical protein D5E85_24930 [Vibrio parahaemolyticus]